MQRCKFCGNELSVDDRFCGQCGHTVNVTEVEKDVSTIPSNSLHRTEEWQYHSTARETVVLDRGEISSTVPQYNNEGFSPTIPPSSNSLGSEFHTLFAEPWTLSPRNADPKTPPVDIGSWMRPASHRRRPILIVVTLAIVSFFIISGVIGFISIKAKTSQEPVKPAVLVVSPSSLDFGELEKSVTLTLPFSISNTGGQRLNWSLNEDSGTTKWLSVQTRSATIEPGVMQQKDNVTVNTIALPLGPSFANLTIDSNGGKVTVTVKVDVLRPGSPKLNVMPTSLNFGTYAMSMPVPHQSIMLINGGTVALKWKVNDGSAPWLTLDKNSSTTWTLPSGDKQVINIAVNNGLTPANYTATVIITSNGGNKHVPLSLVVISPPTPQARLTVNSLSLNFDPVVANTSLTKQVIVSNTGRQPLNWTATAQASVGGSWLSIANHEGTINPGAPAQTIYVKADATRLAVGSYSGTVTINASGALGSPTQVEIKLTVVTPPQLGANPTSLNFGSIDQGAIATKPVTVSNPGGQAMTWTAAVQTNNGGSWLSIDNHGGTINPGAPSQMINVKVDATSLEVGGYTGMVTITAPGAQGSPTTIDVALSVVAPCTMVMSTSALAFTVQQGQSAAGQNLNLSESGTCALPVSLSLTGDSGSSGWLVYSPTSSTDNGSGATITVSANASSTMAPGTYTGTITVSAQNSGGNTVQESPQTVTVTLTVTGYNISGVLDGCTDSTCASLAPLPGATFVLLDSTGNQVASVVTDASGNYSFSDLPLGSYTVSVTDSANNHYVAGSTFTVSEENQTGVVVYVYPG